MPDSFSATSFPSNIEERNYQYLKAISAMQTQIWPQRLCLVGRNNVIAVNAVKLEKAFFIWILKLLHTFNVVQLIVAEYSDFRK